MKRRRQEGELRGEELKGRLIGSLHTDEHGDFNIKRHMIRFP